MAKQLLGKEVTAALNEKIIGQVKELKEKGVSPKLGIIRVGERPDDISYETGATKRCDTLGVEVEKILLPEDVSKEELLAVIDKVNKDDTIHGVLMFRPLPAHLKAVQSEIENALDPAKDVDCMTHLSLAGVFEGKPLGFPPCTPQACMEILDYYGIDCKGKNAVVIGRSLVVGKPAAMMLMGKNATVTVCHTKTVDVPAIAREADNVFYTLAGPEISVATTKAYSTQLIATYALAIQFAKVRGQITEEQYTGYIEELQTIPDKISKIIADKERIQWFAAKQANAKDAFFVGRGIDYAISLEGSLKMKEISYIHSEAYAAGELKHGTISLIEDGTLVIGVLTQPDLYEKTVSNMVECKSRGAYLMGLTTFGHYNIEDTADFTVYIPKTDPHFATSLAVIPLQLMGYYVSVAKGLDVDKPRNLAKSVTVE